MTAKSKRFPLWLHRRLPPGGQLMATHQLMKSASQPTVCEEAKCPNLLECYAKKTATFLAMGSQCTRACPFCSIEKCKNPQPLDPKEPERIAHLASELGLKHVVVTMVTRDDLDDGGANHLVKIIQELREKLPHSTIEVLTSDFQGNEEALFMVLKAEPEIFNHNVETVRRLTPKVRHKATYDRSLGLLRFAREHGNRLFVKSGLMVGLGESIDEVKETLLDMKRAGCDIVTIGQYLPPTEKSLKMQEFISPSQFEEYAKFGLSIGIRHLFSQPFVRSSYNAGALFEEVKRS